MRALTIYELKNWFLEYKNNIIDSKISKIHSTIEGLILELYKSNLQERYFYIIPGKSIFLSKIKLKKLPIGMYSKFILYLKKKIVKQSIENIELLFPERIIKIKLNDYILYIELFSKGNIILTNLENKIIYALYFAEYSQRKILKGEIYKYPTSSLYIPKDFEDFYTLLKNSDKKDIVRFLALELKIGGNYAEYICKSLNIDKNTPLKEFYTSEKKEILNDIYKLFLKILNSKKGFLEYTEDKKVIKDFYIGLREENDINYLFEQYYINNLKYKSVLKILEKKEQIKKILEEQYKTLQDLRKNKELLYAIANFLSTYSWIFTKDNIRNPKLIEMQLKNIYPYKNIKVNLNNKYLEIDIPEDILEDFKYES